MRGEGGVAAEGRLAGEPKIHSWGKYTQLQCGTGVEFGII